MPGSMPTKPKCKLFGQLALHGKLLTADMLAIKGWPHDPLCPVSSPPYLELYTGTGLPSPSSAERGTAGYNTPPPGAARVPNLHTLSFSARAHYTACPSQPSLLLTGGATLAPFPYSHSPARSRICGMPGGWPVIAPKVKLSNGRLLAYAMLGYARRMRGTRSSSADNMRTEPNLAAARDWKFLFDNNGSGFSIHV
ncbi:uncharacterized protein LOC124680664 [Lolium rigidum]|uniref:uncharacterized protein LOC124680664 n=1 Tax=Lolium rigidum TaxID=89674 RepID=UPI001F5CEB71|nr:uncharacterized protein LOC124680664 [Lolium rigidum]